MTEVVMSIDITLESHKKGITPSEAMEMMLKELDSLKAPWASTYLAILNDDGDIVFESFRGR